MLLQMDCGNRFTPPIYQSITDSYSVCFSKGEEKQKRSMLKSIVATITRYKQNEDKILRTAEEDIKISSVEGNPEYCKIETPSGDPILVKGIDLVEAVKHSCTGENSNNVSK